MFLNYIVCYVKFYKSLVFNVYPYVILSAFMPIVNGVQFSALQQKVLLHLTDINHSNTLLC